MGLSITEPELNGFTALKIAENQPEAMALFKSFSLKSLLNSTINDFDIYTAKKKHFNII
jgi:hypothetical protein